MQELVSVICPVAHLLRRLHRDQRGATAIEFGLLGLTLILMLLGVLQYALVYVTALQLKSALSEAAASANSPLHPEYKDPLKVRAMICSGLTLADSCAANLKLEQIPAKTLAASKQPIVGATYSFGALGDVLVMRAAAPVVTFVPGAPPFSVSGAAVWLNR